MDNSLFVLFYFRSYPDLNILCLGTYEKKPTFKGNTGQVNAMGIIVTQIIERLAELRCPDRRHY